MKCRTPRMPCRRQSDLCCGSFVRVDQHGGLGALEGLRRDAKAASISKRALMLSRNKSLPILPGYSHFLRWTFVSQHASCSWRYLACSSEKLWYEYVHGRHGSFAALSYVRFS